MGGELKPYKPYFSKAAKQRLVKACARYKMGWNRLVNHLIAASFDEEGRAVSKQVEKALTEA